MRTLTKYAYLDDVDGRWLSRHCVWFNLHTCKCVCVCFAYSSNLQLCNILMNLLLLLLKDVGLHYNQNLETTKKTRLFSECLVWSSCLVLFSFLHLFFAFVGLTSRKHNNSRCLGVSWTRDTGPCIIHFCIHMDNLYIYTSVYIHTSRQAGRQADRQTDG